MLQNTPTGTELIFILDKASHPLSSELTQPHSNFSLRLIPSRCTKKRFKHLFMSTAIQMYSASCHSGCKLSRPTSGALQPRCLLLSLSIAPDCFPPPCSLHPPHPNSSDQQAPLQIFYTSVSEPKYSFLISSSNVHKLLRCVIIIRSDHESSYCDSFFLF